MDMSDAEFWGFLALVVPVLFVPAGIAWWKGNRVGPVAVLSLVFWPGALILALRGRSHSPREPSDTGSRKRY